MVRVIAGLGGLSRGGRFWLRVLFWRPISRSGNYFVWCVLLSRPSRYRRSHQWSI